MNIYVGNFPKTCTEEIVRGLFEEHGEVTDIKLISDQYTGELRGFGFIQMPLKADGEKAILKMNGFEVEGRKLIVNEARPRSNNNNRSGSGGGFKRGGSGGGGGGGGNRGQRNRW